MGVQVDETGSDDHPGRVDDRSASILDPPNGNHPPVGHPHVGEASWGAGAVHHRATADHKIEHRACGPFALGHPGASPTRPGPVRGGSAQCAPG